MADLDASLRELSGSFTAAAGRTVDLNGANLQFLTGTLAPPPFFDVSLRDMTGAFGGQDLAASLSELTGSFETQLGGVAALDAELSELTSSLVAQPGGVAELVAELEALSALLSGPPALSADLQSLSAQFTALAGRVATISAQFSVPQASFDVVPGLPATLNVSLQQLTASFTSIPSTAPVLSGEMRALRGAFSGISGAVATLDARTRFLTGSFAAYETGTTDSIVAQFEPLSASFYAEQVVQEVFRAWAMNTRLAGTADRAGNKTSAITEYENFPFNSFARFNGVDLAAGPGGLFKLAGALDDEAKITRSFATGFLDFDTTELKRATEVFLALRTDGTLEITVWTDEDTSFEYIVPWHGRDTLQQLRKLLGKGLRSRYFKYQVSGMDGASFDVDAMTIEAAKLSRREG